VVIKIFINELTHVRLEAFTAVTMKNCVFWDVTPCDSCKNRGFEELGATSIRVTRIGELGTPSIYLQRASVASYS
jgi:hypothetical protein